MSTSAERMRRLRERRAAALVPVDGPRPLAEEDRLVPAVRETLEALQATPMSRPPTRKPGPARPNRIQQLRAAHAQHPAVRKRGS